MVVKIATNICVHVFIYSRTRGICVNSFEFKALDNFYGKVFPETQKVVTLKQQTYYKVNNTQTHYTATARTANACRVEWERNKWNEGATNE